MGVGRTPQPHPARAGPAGPPPPAAKAPYFGSLAASGGADRRPWLLSFLYPRRKARRDSTTSRRGAPRIAARSFPFPTFFQATSRFTSLLPPPRPHRRARLAAARCAARRGHPRGLRPAPRPLLHAVRRRRAHPRPPARARGRSPSSTTRTGGSISSSSLRLLAGAGLPPRSPSRAPHALGPTFLARRAARVLPGFHVALLVTLAFHRSTPALPGFASSPIAHALVLQGYLQPGGIVIIGAAWSLTTEAHFYLLLPLIAPLLLDRARGLGRPLLFGGALVLGAWATRAWLHDHRSFPACAPPGSRTRSGAGSRAASISSCSAPSPPPRTSRSPAAPRRSPRATPPSGLRSRWSRSSSASAWRASSSFEPRGSWPYAIISLATALLVLAATLLDERAHPFLAPRAHGSRRVELRLLPLSPARAGPRRQRAPGAGVVEPRRQRDGCAGPLGAVRRRVMDAHRAPGDALGAAGGARCRGLPWAMQSQRR